MDSTAKPKIREAYRIPERNEFFMSWDGGDPWGSTISHLFGIAEAVYAVSGEVWEEYSPPPFTPRDDLAREEYPDSIYREDLERGLYTLEALHDWYRILLRYDALLRHAGLDY